MSVKKNRQITPFPLPPYLASYFANKITSEPITLENGLVVKPFSVNRKSEFGKFIYRCLKKTNKPVFIEKGFTFFIEFSEFAYVNDSFCEDGRYSFLELNSEEVAEITSVFKAVFEEALFNFVAGFIEAFSEFTNKKRGYLETSITRFCDLNGVIYTDKNFEAWRKLIQRSLKKCKLLKSRVL